MIEGTRWGRLTGRYAAQHPRRILALDGGGIRGLLTLQVLAELERQLSERCNDGKPIRLSQFFDYIGGTSTGAILAAGLAVGHSCDYLMSFYQEFGKRVFEKRSLFARWKSLYTDEELKLKLKEVFGDRDLGPEGLETLFLAVTHNVSTDSAWPISSNPDAKYNAPERADCNLRLPLWQLVRASTAAPAYFPPEVIELGDNRVIFADGGTTSYNNPAFLMTRMASEPAYRLGWPRGEQAMLVVSLGTGAAPIASGDADDPEVNIAAAAGRTLKVLMSQAAFDQDVNCRTVGRCVHGGRIDGEVGDLILRDDQGAPLPLADDQGRAFLYARYDAMLTDAGLAELGVQGVDAEAVRALDSVDNMDALATIGRALAGQVDVGAFGSFLQAPLYPRLNVELE